MYCILKSVPIADKGRRGSKKSENYADFIIGSFLGPFCHSSEGLRQEMRFSCFLDPPSLSLSVCLTLTLLHSCSSSPLARDKSSPRGSPR